MEDNRTRLMLESTLTVRPHLHSITYHIHHQEGHWGKEDIWHNHGHFLDPAVHPGCLYVWSLAVWAHIDSAKAQRTHSSIQHTADLWSICNSSRTICSFFWPSLSRHTFCCNLSAPNEDKGEHQSLIYQSTLNYLKVPCTDGWIMSTWRPFCPPADFFYLPPPDMFLRILKSTNDKLGVSKSELKDEKSRSLWFLLQQHQG